MIEALVRGDGQPVTAFAHGFAGSIAETRPFASGLDGTKLFFHFRGHGATPSADGSLSYDALADELLQVRDEYGASRAVGVSLGAGAVLAALVRRPDAFERVVLVIPAAIDKPRSGRAVERVEAMARSADRGDVDGLTALLLHEQPAEVRDGRVVQAWARAQATRMTGEPLRSWVRLVPQLHPLADAAELEAISCPALVIGQSDDEAHPSELVTELISRLPNATGEILGPGGVLWTHRAHVRELIAGFLNA